MLSYITYLPFFTAVLCIYKTLHRDFNLYYPKLLCTACILYTSNNSNLNPPPIYLVLISSLKKKFIGASMGK